jgi:hypothetical protein
LSDWELDITKATCSPLMGQPRGPAGSCVRLEGELLQGLVRRTESRVGQGTGRWRQG